jgi:hypothetical protein
MWKFLCKCPPISTHDKILIICLIKNKKTENVEKKHFNTKKNEKN